MRLTLTKAWMISMPLVFLVKFLLFAADPQPGLFLGDSLCYLATALEGWAPPDRSFTYGYVIRLTAVLGNSLTSLVAFQVLASAATAVLLVYTLEKYFAVNSITALVFGILCAIEPIQLLYERFVMTECLSLFVFALYLVSIFKYLQTPSLRGLFLVQLAGVILITLRVSFLPIVLLCTVAAPLLTANTFVKKAELLWPPFKISGKYAIPRSRLPICIIGIHLLASVGLTFILHTGYKQIYSNLSGGPPSYNLKNGYFLLSAWTPVVEPADFPYPDMRAEIFNNLAFDLKDRAMRVNHMFDEGGLVEKISMALPDPTGNKAAQETAMNALKRDPTGVLNLSFRTFLDFFNLDILREKIINDLGMDITIPSRDYFEQKFFLSVRGLSTLPTLTKTYYRNAIPWYWLLLFSPIICSVALLTADRMKRCFLLVVCIAAACSAGTTFALSPFPIVRYLHPLTWLTFLAAGILAERMRLQLKSRSTS
jgi:hypothetical protein